MPVAETMADLAADAIRVHVIVQLQRHLYPSVSANHPHNQSLVTGVGLSAAVLAAVPTPNRIEPPYDPLSQLHLGTLLHRCLCAKDNRFGFANLPC